jgi:hypothetical protein
MNYPEFYQNLKRDLLGRIYSFIKPVMQRAKEKEIQKYRSRADYQQIMQNKNLDKCEIERIIMNEYNLKQLEEGNIFDVLGQERRLRKK